MRLIDIDKIEINEKCIFSGKGIKDFLDAIPTAYDVDKVVERLEELKRCEESRAVKYDEAGKYGGGTYPPSAGKNRVRPGAAAFFKSCMGTRLQNRRAEVKEGDIYGDVKDKCGGKDGCVPAGCYFACFKHCRLCWNGDDGYHRRLPDEQRRLRSCWLLFRLF